MSCLILFKSITYAQNAAQHLKKRGINAYLVRTPLSLSGGGCGYSLKIKHNDIESAKKTLESSHVKYLSVYKVNNQGGYSAV